MRYLLTVLLILTSLVFQAQDPCMPPKPDLETQDNVLFYDMASFIDDGAEKRINDKLVKFFRETSNQIAIVVADDLCGYEPAQYATRLGHDWGVGREKEDNGVVILMRPKRDGQKGEIFIATGYGMEGPIPDVYANRITDNIMIPYFKQNQYPQGLEAGMQVVMDLAQGEYNEQVAMVQGEGEGEGEMISLFMIFILILLALMAYSYHRRVTNYAEVNKLAYWAAFFMLMNQHGHTGSFDDFNQGSGPFRRMGRGSGGFGGGSFGGSSGGGSFGGFGGGGFGGGGAGGSW